MGGKSLDGDENVPPFLPLYNQPKRGALVGRVTDEGAGVGAKRNVITGGTGLLGSHIAEALAARGEHVRALVRPTSDVTFLRALGAELAAGDLHDLASLRRAVAGADVVYHCAARVGDWGPWRLYQREVIDATRNLLDACRAEGVGRVLYVSSVTVYGHPRRRGAPITEDEPLGQNQRWFWDYYCHSKIAAEALARAYGPGLTVVRPSWIYGPRDRTSLPRLMAAFRAGRVTLIGPGDNLLNIVHAADVADGCIRAANYLGAGGRAYNLCSEGELTQRQFLDALTEALGLPPVRRRVPFWLAYAGGLLSEVIGRAIFLRRPPHITRYGVGLVGRPTLFSSARARGELGWQPRVGAREGLRRTLEWWQSQAPAQPASR
jgi:nucleoside-diphosphate-sugar epimerase